MSALIGKLAGPHGNSPNDIVGVWSSVSGVETVVQDGGSLRTMLPNLDPIVARNLAALLVRGADEVERLRDRRRLSGEGP